MANIFKPPCDEAVIQSAADTSPCIKKFAPWILVATIIGSSMAFIDGTVVNVALPVLQAELGATVTDVQWIVESYALFLAALILVGGSLGDHFGRRRIFAMGVALFAAASMWCGMALSTQQLIIARAVQGIGGALLVPGSLAIISASFSEEQRGQAIGTWSGSTAITAALGPVLGGWLIENVSWRWIFFINVPLAMIVIVILLWRVPESRDEEEVGRVDWWGAVLATIGLGSIVYGLIETANLGLGHPLVICTLVIGVVALIAFLILEKRISAPMMPLRLFHSRTFSGANLLTLLLYSALSGTLFFVPFNLIQIQGYTATAAGAAFLPLILLLFLLSRWAGKLVSRHGARLPLTIGPGIAAVGFALFAVPGIGGSYWSTFFPAIVVLGVGMAISVAPLSTAIMGAVAVRHSGIASGINNAVSRTAGLLAIAVLGIIILNAFNNHLDRHLATLQIPQKTQHLIDEQRIKLAGAEVTSDINPELKINLEQAIADAFVDSFRLVMYIATGLAIVSAFISWLMIEGLRTEAKPGSSEADESGLTQPGAASREIQ